MGAHRRKVVFASATMASGILLVLFGGFAFAVQGGGFGGHDADNAYRALFAAVAALGAVQVAAGLAVLRSRDWGFVLAPVPWLMISIFAFVARLQGAGLPALLFAAVCLAAVLASAVVWREQRALARRIQQRSFGQAAGSRMP